MNSFSFPGLGSLQTGSAGGSAGSAGYLGMMFGKKKPSNSTSPSGAAAGSAVSGGLMQQAQGMLGQFNPASIFGSFGGKRRRDVHPSTEEEVKNVTRTNNGDAKETEKKEKKTKKVAVVASTV